MTATAASVTRQLLARTAVHRVASLLLAAEIVLGVAVVVALAIVGAADAAGLDLLVPAPGPMPVPSAAPPGLDL